LKKKENTGKEEEEKTPTTEDNNEKVNEKNDAEKDTEIITAKEEKGSEINDDNTDKNVDLSDVNEQSKTNEISTASSTEEKQETKEEPNKEETNNEQTSVESVSKEETKVESVSKEETKVEEARKEDINNEAKIKEVMAESHLQGYGYFTETNSSTELFYILDPKNKLLFAFDREKMEKFHNIGEDQTVSDEERKPTHSYNFAKEATEVSRISYSSVHSDSALKVLFKVQENILVLCPSNANSKKKEKDFFYALKDISMEENIEVPVPPSNGCCTIV